VPLLPYGYVALDRLWGHLYEGEAWPVDAPAPAARPRGVGVLDRGKLGLP
jgi:hydroxybutyrate-dimer hydrolase